MAGQATLFSDFVQFDTRLQKRLVIPVYYPHAPQGRAP